MAKKVVAVVGTYRRGRTIDTAVAELLAAARDIGAETELIDLREKTIEFCTNCRKCTQASGIERTGCAHSNDDMQSILEAIDSADALVLASPVNFFTVTALMKRFIERLIVCAYWPWSKLPKPRNKKLTRTAVTMTSSAAPAFLARLVMRNPQSLLRAVARLLGAKVVTTLHFGTAAASEEATLNENQRQKARHAAEKLLR